MSILIFGKLFAGGASLVVATLVMYHGTKLFLDVDVSVYGFTNAFDESKKADESISHIATTKNFRCQIVSGYPFECEIQEFKFDDKNKFLIERPNDGPDFPIIYPTKKEDLQAKDKVFKITAKKSQLKGWDASSTKIEILHWHDGLVSKETKNKYADITGLFSEEKNKFLGKTQYFVGKAKSTTETLSKTANTCAWTDESFPAPKKDLNYVNCVVHIFGNASLTPNNLDAWTFTKKSDATSDTTIEQDKYYLIAFTDTQDIIEKGTKTVIFAKTSDADTQLVEFTEIYSAVLVENKNLLILG